MSSSQDVTESLLSSGRVTSSLSENANESVGLCDTCEEAHDHALHDGYNSWKRLEDSEEFKGPPAAAVASLPTDEWPDLPHLGVSADAGCKFCRFLRGAILSKKFDDALRHSAEGSLLRNLIAGG